MLNKQYLEPLTIYYDLECVLRSTDPQNCGTCISICKCEADNTRKVTIPKQIHVPIIYSYVVLDKNGKIFEQDTQYCPRGDASTRLLSRLLDNQQKYLDFAKGPKKFQKVPHVSNLERRKILKNQENRCLHCHKTFQPGQRKALDRM